jgi:acetyl-CoA C-acetyltransferase
MSSSAYIVDAVRTAGGRRNGKLAAWHPADLAGEVLNAVIERAKIDPATVEDVILGCVTQAGEQSFAFARNAVLASTKPSRRPGVAVAPGESTFTRIPVVFKSNAQHRAIDVRYYNPA